MTRPGRSMLAANMLAAATLAWAALPMHGAGRGAKPALIAAGCCALLSAAQLATRLLAGRSGRAGRPQVYVPPAVGWAQRAWISAQAVPWPQGMTVAVLALEALHPARPWHTVALGAALAAFLLVLHLAESDSGLGALRPQLPLIAAGIGLAALSAGATASSGPGWLSMAAAVAAVLVAGLALPV